MFRNYNTANKGAFSNNRALQINKQLFVPVSSASAIAFSLITAHTVAHSITVVACSPAYKKTIRRLVVESINVIRGRSSVDRIRTRQSLQVSRFDYSRY